MFYIQSVSQESLFDTVIDVYTVCCFLKVQFNHFCHQEDLEMRHFS